MLLLWVVLPWLLLWPPLVLLLLLQLLLLKLGLALLQWVLLLLLLLLLLLASLALWEQEGRKEFSDLERGGRKKFCDGVLGMGGTACPDWGVLSLPQGEVSLTGALIGGRQEKNDGRGGGRTPWLWGDGGCGWS